MSRALKARARVDKAASLFSSLLLFTIIFTRVYGHDACITLAIT